MTNPPSFLSGPFLFMHNFRISTNKKSNWKVFILSTADGGQMGQKKKQNKKKAKLEAASGKVKQSWQRSPIAELCFQLEQNK